MLAVLCLGFLALSTTGSTNNVKNCPCKNDEMVYMSVVVATSAPPPDFSPQNRCAPGGTVTIPVSGHDTVLGAFTGTHSHCVAPNSLAFTNGHYTATDADGNVLTGTYSGNLIPTEQSNVFLIDGRFSFTSGELVGQGASGGRVVFNQDGTSDSIAVIDGCVTTKKKL
jgi:hypothetical protein